MTREDASRIADNGYLKAVSRLAAAIGVPVAIFVAGIAWGEFRDLRGDLNNQGRVIAQIGATVVDGHGPRIERLESEIVGIREQLDRRTMDRFTKSDGALLRAELQRDLDSLEKRLAGLERERHRP